MEVVPQHHNLPFVTSCSSSTPPPPPQQVPPSSDFVTVATDTPSSIKRILSYDLQISVDNFALVRASLASMHAEVLRTIKRNDVNDRFKIDTIHNLIKRYKFNFSLFKKIDRD
jgi:predicted DNA binding protein